MMQAAVVEKVDENSDLIEDYFENDPTIGKK